MPLAGWAGSSRTALTPVRSEMRLTANATAGAAVPLVNCSTCAAWFPGSSSDVVVAMLLVRNSRSAVLALETTLTCTGTVLAVPKLASEMSTP